MEVKDGVYVGGEGRFEGLCDFGRHDLAGDNFWSHQSIYVDSDLGSGPKSANRGVQAMSRERLCPLWVESGHKDPTLRSSNCAPVSSLISCGRC